MRCYQLPLLWHFTRLRYHLCVNCITLCWSHRFGRKINSSLVSFKLNILQSNRNTEKEIQRKHSPPSAHSNRWTVIVHGENTSVIVCKEISYVGIAVNDSAEWNRNREASDPKDKKHECVFGTISDLQWRILLLWVCSPSYEKHIA